MTSSQLICEDCPMGKINTLDRNKVAKHKATQKLERVYIDLWGPTRTPTYNGGHYMSMIVDEFTGMKFVYIMRSKSETTAILLSFIEDFGKSSIIRSDCGSEFKGTFTETCGLREILQEFTAPYSQHQDGKAERSIQT